MNSRRFSLQQKNKDDAGVFQTTEVTVYDYFVNSHNIDLPYSADLSCINIRKPKHRTYFPIKGQSSNCNNNNSKALEKSTPSAESPKDKSSTDPALLPAAASVSDATPIVAEG
ncbi:unnamed protein product [Fraxinus pennsylvanica]|uniref:PAZ domain-containing protein n=1 Tax=Fraxinus pennsylvanica TaxID=56036 RepID=A0AAD1ZXN3_9LAMI|nr:unnamed protein product [Fraxinus pennsylvanica]